jgi:hypothetical protein
MKKAEIIRELRNDLASHGTERTPAEAAEIYDMCVQLCETVDDETYAYMAEMTPGKLLVFAHQEKMDDIKEAIDTRNLIMFVYEKKVLGIEDAPWEHPLADPSSNL